MEGQLEDVEGVLEAKVDFETKIATVTVEGGTDPEKVLSGLKDGYSGKIQQ